MAAVITAPRRVAQLQASIALVARWPSFNFQLALPARPRPTQAAILASPTSSWSSLFPSDTLAALRDLLPPWVLAVPKSKTTHSAKRMRSANKGLKEKQSECRMVTDGLHHATYHAAPSRFSVRNRRDTEPWPFSAVTDLVACPSCGAPKVSHHLCHECHVAFRREYHAEAKEQQANARQAVKEA